MILAALICALSIGGFLGVTKAERLLASIIFFICFAGLLIYTAPQLLVIDFEILNEIKESLK